MKKEWLIYLDFIREILYEKKLVSNKKSSILIVLLTIVPTLMLLIENGYIAGGLVSLCILVIFYSRRNVQ